MKKDKLNYRYIARLKVKATTPLFVANGNSSLLKDALVQKNHLGLPMIPGTSLTGVLRHSLLDDFERGKLLEYDEIKQDAYFSILNLFGCQLNSYTEEDRIEKEAFENWYKRNISQHNKAPDGLGSRLIVSSAYFLLGNDKVTEGLNTKIDEGIIFKMNNLPVRQHVRITDKGVAADKGLFDNEIVYKGAQFIFEIELKGTEGDKYSWDRIIETFQGPAFRIGQGTRNGYGNLKVVEIYKKTFDLNDLNDFDAYLNFNPSLNSDIKLTAVEDKIEDKNVTTYHLELKPDDFFIFSEGFGDEDVDNKPNTEEIIEYKDGKLNFEEKTLIPASSIKGALAHRVAYHYNKLSEKYADKINTNDFKNYLNQENKAVAEIFGKKGEVVNRKNVGQRGTLILDDLYYDDIDNDKIFNHVAIDRFTGGGIDGALFSEKVSRKEDGKIELKIYMIKETSCEKIEEALEDSLKDICKGLLPLGGMTTKGFGMFTGTLKKNGTLLFDNKKEMV